MMDAVAKRSAASAAMVDRSAPLRALMGGTRAMREAGEALLPRFAGESPLAYRARLNQSWLFNGLRKTVRDMTGRVFARPPKLVDDPEPYSAWAANIDLAGNDLAVFARMVFADALQSGVSFILVDAPRREGVVTRAQAEAANLRPYFTHVPVEDVLGWRAESIANVMTLTQLRLAETFIAEDPRDEFAQVEVPQVRVLDREPGGIRTRLFRQSEREGKWTPVPQEDGGDFIIPGLSEIPLAPVYVQRAGFMQGEPPLDDLADVNIAHWQSQSDQRNILHFARVPILHASGRDAEDGPIEVSAGTAIVSSDPQARVEWVEHSGHAIGAGRQDLKDLEFQMETFGLQLLVERTQDRSATGAALEAAKETSQLAMFADALKDGLERAWHFAAMFAGRDDAPEVFVNDDFGATPLSAAEAQVLLQAVNTGQISRTTFLGELSRRGMLAEDLDPDEEAERLASEGPDDMTGEPMDLGRVSV